MDSKYCLKLINIHKLIKLYILNKSRGGKTYDRTRMRLTTGLIEQNLLSYLQMFYRITWQYCHDRGDDLRNLGILQARTALVPDGRGLASCSYILYSLCLILGEDGPAAQTD